jgi:hypothetical protein
MKRLFAAFALALMLAACGGGGGGSSASTGTSGSSGSTGQSGSGTPTTSASTTLNVVNVTVEKAFNYINEPYVSLTICAPGTQNCATIDHVIVDTGSVGLRLLRSAIPASLGLTNATDPVQGNTLAECSEFGAGHAWGPISTVDLKIAGETASALPMQIVDDTFASMPADCASFGPDMVSNGAQSFGGNGLIGVDVLRRDCLESCQSVASTLYYDCAGTNCSPVAMPLTNQVPNPISRFASDNNGMTLSFPAVPQGGSASVTGTMTFGINTESNNAPPTVQQLTTTASATTIATYNGQTMQAILDSGSGAYYFPNASITECPLSFSSAPWLCPSQTSLQTATLQGELGGSLGIDFDIYNAVSELTGSSNGAHAGIGENTNLFGVSLLDLGLPYFFGKTITFGIQGNDNFTAGTWPFFQIQA